MSNYGNVSSTFPIPYITNEDNFEELAIHQKVLFPICCILSLVLCFFIIACYIRFDFYKKSAHRVVLLLMIINLISALEKVILFFQSHVTNYAERKFDNFLDSFLNFADIFQFQLISIAIFLSVYCGYEKLKSVIFKLQISVPFIAFGFASM